MMMKEGYAFLLKEQSKAGLSFGYTMLLYICLIIVCFFSKKSFSENPVSVLTISGRVISKTCAFENESQIFYLSDVNTNAFKDSRLYSKKEYSININCGSGVSAVKVVVNGSEDSLDKDAFANTGQSTGVALRLLDANGGILAPDGSKEILITPQNLVGKFTFAAAYIATAPGRVTAGTFESLVTLSFSYD
ncbi:MAG TPA: fimbrial protein [Buttiauxella sp.]|jgi:minor fimbrial subunit